ncbi:hypothetical protein BKA62DRAFT_154811 [Auriculariales sp. MPI-PUGE-AT-0066]|nr:hypothetical protein BKA62DRAFT_154811 [Auriculariales sp. MPI-PUGE-AT-0066]
MRPTLRRCCDGLSEFLAKQNPVVQRGSQAAPNTSANASSSWICLFLKYSGRSKIVSRVSPSLPRLSTMISVLLLAALASTVLGETFNVEVGVSADGTQANVFSPDTVQAAAGDMVVFSWKTPDGLADPAAVGHTVTREINFDAPCTTMDGGFDSGIKTVGTDGETVSFNVTGTDPVWFYCQPHCTLGMVFAINPPETGNTFDDFQAAAQGDAPPDVSDSASDSAASPTGSSTASSTGRPTGTNSGSVSSPSASHTTSHTGTAPATSGTTPAGGAASLVTVSAGALAAVAVAAVAAVL